MNKEKKLKQAQEHREKADRIEELKEELRDADSIAEDVPALSELFHRVRTSKRDSRDGKYKAVLNYKNDGWTCEKVAFQPSGGRLKHPDADLVLAMKPFPFMEVKEFSQHMASSCNWAARNERQTAGSIEHDVEMYEQQQKVNKKIREKQEEGMYGPE